MSEPEHHVLLDASVLVELVVHGRHRAAADRLLDRINRDPAIALVTAAHGLVEAVNALRKLVRRSELAEPEGEQAVNWLRRLDIVLDASSPRLGVIWQLRDSMSAYDAAYAAAAQALGLPLITTDRRLLAACGAAGIDAVHFDDAVV
jgi:predicted nucleic acid-binding protein